MDVPDCTYLPSYLGSDIKGSNTIVIGNVISCLAGTCNIGPLYCTSLISVPTCTVSCEACP